VEDLSLAFSDWSAELRLLKTSNAADPKPGGAMRAGKARIRL
jgi:hypothetical protein